jgi:hypothetical protein
MLQRKTCRFNGLVKVNLNNFWLSTAYRPIVSGVLPGRFSDIAKCGLNMDPVFQRDDDSAAQDEKSTGLFSPADLKRHPDESRDP